VSEAKIGENLTHIDDCHVLVIQEGGHNHGLDFDKFVISKIREITVRFEPRQEKDKENNLEFKTVDIALDPKITMETVLSRLSSSVNINQANLELYKCYSTKSMMKRPAEFPVELESERNLESLLEWCKEGTKTVYYRLKTEPRKSGSVTPMPHPVLPPLDLGPVSGSEPDVDGVCLSVEEDIMDTA